MLCSSYVPDVMQLQSQHDYLGRDIAAQYPDVCQSALIKVTRDWADLSQGGSNINTAATMKTSYTFVQALWIRSHAGFDQVCHNVGSMHAGNSF